MLSPIALCLYPKDGRDNIYLHLLCFTMASGPQCSDVFQTLSGLAAFALMLMFNFANPGSRVGLFYLMTSGRMVVLLI